MYQEHRFFIDGHWVKSSAVKLLDVINPATEQPCGQISLGRAEDVDKAVTAAVKAFETWGFSTRQERMDLFDAIIASYQEHYDELAEVISQEMGAPITLARESQAAIGLGHLMEARGILETFAFEQDEGDHRILKEPVGVCGLITPWNWPINQITCKVAPALAAGCTMVLKPSEVAPLSACVFAKIMEKAGVPKGVFNLVNGDGAGVGVALSSHPDIDMMSFTGSTRAGIQVAMSAAPTVKRVHQELGGKSPNIVLDDVDLEAAVTRGVQHMFNNSGQSCNAPSRMLVPASLLAEAEAIAAKVALTVVEGDPSDPETTMGPVVSEAQFNKIQGLIDKGIDEGARLVCGGPGRPNGLSKGYYVKPTVFSDVNNSMTIAREEIFGPVLCMLPYETEEEAVRIANDTPYGLAAYIQSGNPERAQKLAARLRAGNISINGSAAGTSLPFGGYKQSGNGREWGVYGLHDYLEIKAVAGYRQSA